LNPNTCTKKDLEIIINHNKKGFGEPGFIFLEDEDTGINPCGEIGIDPVWKHEYKINEKTITEQLIFNGKKSTGFGFCNLVEINVASCKNEDEFYNACQAASFIATLQASFTSFPYLGEISENIAKRDALIGVSLTGMMDATFNIFDSGILQAGAAEVKFINKKTAEKIGINPAARCTCIKPSGTSSLELGGVSTGIHPHPAKKYLKRIIANPLEPVAQFFKKFNISAVATKPNGDLCLTFPIKTKGKTINDYTALQFLSKIYWTYINWICSTHYNIGEKILEKDLNLTHNISCTITVKENEWDGVLNDVWCNRDKIRCMTFLPELSHKNIPYIPNEPVKDDNYLWNYIVDNYQEVDYELMEEFEDNTLRGAACDSDKCQLEDRTFISGDGYRIFEGYQRPCNFIRDGIQWRFIKQKNNYFIAQRINE
jgi:ribonucleoside-diphosphate reductase alpha chain